MPRSELSPAARAEAQRALDAAARRLVAERAHNDNEAPGRTSLVNLEGGHVTPFGCS